jgi:hypothetical protein
MRATTEDTISLLTVFDQQLADTPAAIKCDISTQAVGHYSNTERKLAMLYTLAVILVILWVLGLVSSYTMGGFVHLLLVIAIVVVLVRVIQGRRAV